MTIAISGTNGITLDGQFNSASSMGFKNRLINSAMVIDQRNAGASVTQSSSSALYPVDRFAIFGTASSKFTAQQNAGSVTPPAGFTKYLGITSSAATSLAAGDYYRVYQAIEGLNLFDIAYGTASASTMTLSFWVRSSLTGTFGGSIFNDSASRSYPFNYTISSANTWEQKSITFAGDTVSAIATNNSTGFLITWGLGVGSTYGSGTAGAWAAGNIMAPTGATSVVGTSGATFYITGVQLEKGSTATSFDYRPYGTEFNLCLRYYAKSYEYSTALATATTIGMVGGAPALSSLGGTISIPFFTQMRIAPTMAFWDSAGTSSRMTGTTNGSTMTNGLVSTPNGAFNISQNNFWITGNGNATYSMFIHYTASAEL
jgi:hypothetical protein